MLKYVTFIMRADNRGEGGILSLMALAQRALGHRTMLVVGLGVCGAALFYGDAIITPAISVLSAVEGLKTAPSLAGAITPSREIAIALVILVGLFMVQSRGTGRVAALFEPDLPGLDSRPVATLGLMHIPDAPKILLAANPFYGLAFLLSHQWIGLFVLGSVSLSVTGAEALYADMGHFGRSPIRAAWMVVVFPALALNYLGQGAFALKFLSTQPGASLADHNWFFLMAPEFLRVPLVILATTAGIIASQAVISGAYSLSSQAMQLGLLPRLTIKRTSDTEAGQIYVPTINFLLMIGVILLVGIFKNSDNLANAYGLAVTGTMVVDTALATVVVRRLWKWSRWRTILLTVPFLTVDLAFLGANSLKLISGGWAPVLLGGGVVLVISTWPRGSYIIVTKSRRDRIPLGRFSRLPGAPPPDIWFQGPPSISPPTPTSTPSALLHNLKHNGVLHQKNVIVTVITADRPRLAPADRASFEVLSDAFIRARAAVRLHGTPGCPRGHENADHTRGLLRRAGHLLFPRSAHHHRRP